MTRSDNQSRGEKPAKNADVPAPPPASKKKPLEAVLTAVGKISPGRPPPPGTIALTPKPSIAPAPVIRPAMPAPGNIGPSSRSSESSLAAQELANAVSRGRWQEEYLPQKRGAPAGDPLHVRRTLIPILLTIGIILAAAGVLLLVDSQDNALADLFPQWAPIAMLVLAGLSLALGALNILSVKHALRRNEPRKGA